MKKFSDLDLMIENCQDPSAKVLKGEIEETLSNGPLAYKVDLVFKEEFASTYLMKYQKEKIEW